MDASVLPFVNRDQLRELRKKYQETHFFRRTKDEIIAAPLSADAIRLSETLRRVELSHESSLAADLVRRAIIEHLISINRAVIHDRPIEFIADDNLLTRWTSGIAQFPDWFQVRELWEIDVRVMWLKDNQPRVMAAIGLRTKKRVEANCATLLQEGISLNGIYVSIKRPHDNRRCQPVPQLVGKISEVDGDVLQLDDNQIGRAHV